MTVAFSPVSTGGAGNSMSTQGHGSFVVPKISLHLHLLTGDHISATYATKASIWDLGPLFVQQHHCIVIHASSHALQIQSICTRYLHTIPNAAWSLRKAQESRPCCMALPLVCLINRSSHILVPQECIGKDSHLWPKYDSCILPSIHWWSRLFSEHIKVYFIYSGSFVVPKVSLPLHLLTGDHISATHAAETSIWDLVPLMCNTTAALWFMHYPMHSNSINMYQVLTHNS